MMIRRNLFLGAIGLTIAAAVKGSDTQPKRTPPTDTRECTTFTNTRDLVLAVIQHAQQTGDRIVGDDNVVTRHIGFATEDGSRTWRITIYNASITGNNHPDVRDMLPKRFFMQSAVRDAWARSL